MTPRNFLIPGCAALLAALVGCSSPEPEAPAPAQPGETNVTLGGKDVGPTSDVSCATEGGRTIITIEGGQTTTVNLTDEKPPVVKSVSIGEAGSGGPSLLYAEGVSATPASATRDGNRYTVSGTGMGTDAANPMVPVETPFEIVVTCP
ncbi:lipoprotein LpqH [Mycobacterium hubeiense]|uniref:lipoprotein LpqH n=1 Tax=Mycobacterium hubeiense TaxID=1867256 RepID=UPI001E645A4D|nr:lipoprotein LpqH [Mycobacterium sp. QGD 101]